MMDILGQIMMYGINAHDGVQPCQTQFVSGTFVQERSRAILAVRIDLVWRLAYMRGYQYAVEYFDRTNA